MSSFARSNPSFAHGNLGGRNSSNFVQRNFGASTHFGGQSLQRQNTFANRSIAQNNVTHGNNLASFSGSRSGANLAAGHLHQSLFNGGHLNHNVSSNFARNVNLNTNVNRNFNSLNSRWSGGWNRWGNRSFFFGTGTPFGGFYRGYYPGYGYGFRRGFGFGLGFYPYYYGYGYPYYYGYPGYSYASYLNYYPYYNNYGGYGYGNYGYGGSGYPATYGSYAYPYDTTTYNGYAAATAPYGANYSGGPSGALPAAGNVIAATAPGPSPIADDPNPQTAAQDNAPRSVDDITAADFSGQGELDFKAGKYDPAARNFRHALVDDPSNAAVLMLLGQALFATGQYDEAAGATAMAMQSLPPDKWGAVLENYQQLYGRVEDYAGQLRALEKARDAKPDSPGLHFLLGFQYGFSGHPAQAIAELGKTLAIEPKDQMAKALGDHLRSKLKGATEQTPVAPFNAPGKASGRPPQLPGGGLR
jgi:tetratricopeptide (TPR) repeat protein